MILSTFVLMGFLTMVARSFFFIPDAEWTLPRWAERGSDYAPIAALTGAVVPEVVLTRGQFIHTWGRTARLLAMAAGAALFLTGAKAKARRCWVPLWSVWRYTFRCIWVWAGSRSPGAVFNFSVHLIEPWQTLRSS
jgi:branched-subunit amino acid transport protein